MKASTGDRMLVDTSGLLCIFDKSDRRHSEASELYLDAPLLLTHNYVLAEFIPLCNARRHEKPASIEFISEFVDNPDLTVVWVDEVLHRSGLNLIRARQDKAYSLCDAISFVLMRE